MRSLPILEIPYAAIIVAFGSRSDKHVGWAVGVARRYEDRRPDLADLCGIRLSELHPRHMVITVDAADFRIYRRNKREVIPLLCRPAARG